MTLHPHFKHSSLYLQECKDVFPHLLLGESILTEQITEFHPRVKESKALLLTLLSQPYSPSGSVGPYLNLMFDLFSFPERVDENNL